MGEYGIYIIAGLITGLGFLMQRLTGFGSALIATPFLVAIWNPYDAINLQLIFQLLFGALLLHKTWRSLLGERMRYFTLASVPMLALGAYCLPEFSPVVIKVSLGVILLIVISQWIFAPQFKIPERFQKPSAVIFGFLTGTIHGIYGTGGPFLLAYYANVEKQPSKIRNANIAFFGVANFIRLPVAAATAQINAGVLTAAAFTLIPFIFFMILGRRLEHLVDIHVFRILTVIVLTFAICSLLFG